MYSIIKSSARLFNLTELKIGKNLRFGNVCLSPVHWSKYSANEFETNDIDDLGMESNEFEQYKTVDIYGCPVKIRERDVFKLERFFVGSTTDWTIPAKMRMRQYDSDEFVRDSVVYRGQNPPNYIQSAAKLWLACVYAIKQIYIPIRVQCNSHRGMRELNTIVMHSINDPVIGNTFLQAWRFGEDFHKYSYGKLTFDHAYFDSRMAHIHKYVKTVKRTDLKALRLFFKRKGIIILKGVQINVEHERKLIQWGRKTFPITYVVS